MIELEGGCAHRVLAPRIVFLLGTKTSNGGWNCIPICNLGVISSDPEIILVAVYRKWLTYLNLQATDGFTLSVPRKEDLSLAWKLGGRSSGYTEIASESKEIEFGDLFDNNFSENGPVLEGALAWLECRSIRKIDDIGDHIVVFGEVTRAMADEDFYASDGTAGENADPLMQWSGNKFTAPGCPSLADYFDHGS